MTSTKLVSPNKSEFNFRIVSWNNLKFKGLKYKGQTFPILIRWCGVFQAVIFTCNLFFFELVTVAQYAICFNFLKSYDRMLKPVLSEMVIRRKPHSSEVVNQK